MEIVQKIASFQIILGVFSLVGGALGFLIFGESLQIVSSSIVAVLFFIAAFGVSKVKKWGFYFAIILNIINGIGIVLGNIITGFLSIASIYFLYKYRKIFLGK